MFFFRRKGSKLQQILGLLVLTACATIMLKVYTTRDCELADLRTDAKSPNSAVCRDRLYPHLHLSPTDGTNCSRILRGDIEALQQAARQRLEVAHKHQPITEGFYLNQTQDCNSYRASRRFMPVALSLEEEAFPIAYSMVIHKNIEMFERLLRSLYAPQNIYCVHVDAKAPTPFLQAVQAIANCFPNVFVASKLEKVIYASWSRVQADLNCMEDLLKSPVPWRYLINTCGTDFPIKTNGEMVRALCVLNGRNSMESERTSEYKKKRWQLQHKVENSNILQTGVAKAPPPISSPMFSGSAYIVVSREFVRAVFEEPVVRKLVEWEQDTYSPDEHLWATLHRMPEVPGSIPHNNKYELSDMNALPRLVKWQYMEGDVTKGAPYPPCTGAHQRSVCIYGAGDLHWMLQQHHLLANKFDPSVDNTAIQCLEEYLRHKSLYDEEL
ncbi:beta-1,3-galactosyl-O-glycosyl-glycoprotein beta-1,6-N-acetylglucosaminyltransferase 3-like [Ambystoma mexicanum]|uniref:beta-1,3-galactosyl-O-glycosyl-glycoprotein beta-1,6-N-acetylglucosaminyltransferase 3-like n=1 Tax=Ambystoma mexicanum TaxID=8296 RepID=UPI0037E95D3F